MNVLRVLSSYLMLLPSQMPVEIRTSKMYFALLEKLNTMQIMTVILEEKMQMPYGVTAYISAARMIAH